MYSPAGCAVAVELSEEEQKAYETTVTTPSALAYLRARQVLTPKLNPI